MADRAELAPGLVISGRYRVEQLLGKGGMGAVYVVHHVKTEEKLALKVLHSTEMADAMALERFQREARAPARIDSDHVVRVTDADVAKELDGAPFLVMELLKGRDLDRELAEVGTLPPEVVIRYLRQLARALDKAHKLGIVHRDLKPENIFLSLRDDGTTQVKILDFGIAKLTQSEAGSGAKTATGALTGTPFYMAPEQLRGDNANVGGHTDIWAIGIIAHKMLTGADFWTASTVTQLVGQIVYEPIPKASERGASFGDAYDAWFAHCCARKAEERYATMSEAVEALATSLGVAPSSLHSSGSGASIPRAAVSARPIPMHSSADGLARTEVDRVQQRPPRLFIAGTLLVAAGLGGVFAWWYFEGRKQTPVVVTAGSSSSAMASTQAPAASTGPVISLSTPVPTIVLPSSSVSAVSTARPPPTVVIARPHPSTAPSPHAPIDDPLGSQH